MIKQHILAIAFLAAIPNIALAQAEKTDPGSLSDKAMKDQPGTKGGDTAAPTAKPESGTLSDKAMKDAPGTKGGTTAAPTAQPKTGDLPAGAEDAQGK